MDLPRRRAEHDGGVTEEHVDTDRFRGARFERADFSGARFRDSDLRGMKVVDSWLADVHLAGEVARVVINDVDVTAFVEGELDRRHPERVQLRGMKTPDDHRAMWATIERMWSATVERARRLPEATLHERVDEEWSFVETLRHLVFATDAWFRRTVLDEPNPFSVLGLTQSGYPPADAAAIGIDLAARPSLDEVLAVRAGRLSAVRAIVASLTDAGLERLCLRTPAPGYPEEPRTVGRCLRVVMKEEIAHHGYAVRDLAVLEARA
jgi:uncharacterized protein YjbI with pentapeptide repeats